jgi:methyl-accepting chemotaxis protein
MDVRLLSKISVPGKLILSSLAFTLPIAVMSYFIVSGIRYDIRFSEKESYGVEYLRPLVDLISRLPSYPFTSAQNVEAGKIEAAFVELERVQSLRGKDLEVTSAGLAARGRERLEPRLLTERWQALRASHDERAAASLAADLRELVVHVGDLSNLILDPDLDSYYLMDVSLLAVPDAIVRLNAEIARTLGFGGNGDDAAAGEAAVTLFAALYGDIDSVRIAGSSHSALLEDPHFYGPSAEFSRNLPPALERRMTASRALLEAASERTAGGDVDAYLHALSATLDAERDYWAVAAGELDRLIGIRIEHYRSQLLLAILATSLSVLAAFAIVSAIGRNLLVQITDVRKVVSAIAAKDLRVMQKIRSRDELGATAADMAFLAKELNKSLKAFLGAVRSLEQSSVVISTSSSEISHSSGDLATSVDQISAAIEESQSTMMSIRSSVEQQNSAIERTAGSLDESARGLEMVVESMGKLRGMAEQSGAAAAEGATAVDALIEGIERFGAHSRTLTERIGGISETTALIGEVVATIGDVAERTNVLAMNASIEAAHAGAAGRGFAVVAAAIRELSTATTDALHAIVERTAAIDAVVNEAVKDSTSVAALSHDLSLRTGAAEAALAGIRTEIERLVHGIGEAAERVAGYEAVMGASLADALQLRDFSTAIRSAVEEQALGAQEIMKTIIELRSTSEENARSSQSLASLSGTLKAESLALDSIVAEFTLDEDQQGA